jgi:hypothetical protein
MSRHCQHSSTAKTCANFAYLLLASSACHELFNYEASQSYYDEVNILLLHVLYCPRMRFQLLPVKDCLFYCIFNVVNVWYGAQSVMNIFPCTEY